MAHAEILIDSFLAQDQGPAALAGALGASTLKREVAIAGVRLSHASGREVAPLIAALNKAGDLKPLAVTLSPEDRRKLMPPGLTASLRRDELIDVLRYLTSLGAHNE